MTTPAWVWPLVVVIVFVILVIVFFVLYHREPNNKFYLAIAVISLIITIAGIIWLLYALTAKHVDGNVSRVPVPVHASVGLSEL